ncbi:MAG: DNA primase [Hyphomicrobiaceae bacterium]
MRYPPHILDEIRARLPVSQVVARKVALKKAGREYKGLSPFKVEKSPSFFVNDQKGFYHCFASGAHGDIFRFVMETEGLSFPETVERLAAEAGVSLPKPAELTPEAARQEQVRLSLYDLIEASARFFEDKLKAPEGQEARRYLEKRGLKRETVAEFRMGYAPGSRTALKQYLAAQGFTVEAMVESGMLIGGDDIPSPYDRFRNRVMFPIADAKGRLIAFGGRALEADVPAKYLNSPETPLFHKGAVLFNAHRARPLAYDKDRVVAVEGYMDVIALAEAGFGETVAPLGTALTENQVQLLWRMAPEPILCFDGDSAGRKAAFRAVDTVLPLLKPGFSLQFAFLPDGLDPDDLIRQQGPAAFETVLTSRRKPLFDVLIEKEELAGGPTATPEQRSALEQRLKALVARIGDGTVRSHYEMELRQVLWERTKREVRQGVARGGAMQGSGSGLRRNNTQVDWRVRERARLNGPMTGGGGRGRAGGRSAPVLAAIASNELVERQSTMPPREALLLATLLNHPGLIAEEAEVISDLTFMSEPANRLRDALLSFATEEKSLDRAALATQLSDLGLATVVALVQRAITHKGDKFAEPEADPATVDKGWRHAVALHQQEALRRELDAAVQGWEREGSEEAFQRIREIQTLLARRDGGEADS